jgi:hypothetical protein
MKNYSDLKHERIRLISFIVAILAINFNISFLSENHLIYFLKLFLFPFFSLYIFEYLLATGLNKKTITNLLFISLIYIILTSFLYYSLDQILWVSPFQQIHVYQQIDFSPFIKSSFYAIIYLIFKQIQNKIELNETALTQLQTEGIKLENESKENQLRSLKSKIDPSFFNHSLDIIKKTIPLEPKKAEDLTIDLSRFYRKQLDSSEKKFNKLSAEIEHIELYKRFSHFDLEFNYEKSLSDIKIRSGLLLELIKVSKENTVIIDLKSVKDQIQLLINTKDELSVFNKILEKFYSHYNLQQIEKTILIEIPE